MQPYVKVEDLSFSPSTQPHHLKSSAEDRDAPQPAAAGHRLRPRPGGSS